MTAEQHTTSDDIFCYRTNEERARDYLHRGRARQTAAPQTEALFPEPEHEERRFVPIPATPPEPVELFPEPDRSERKLVPVDGWPDG